MVRLVCALLFLAVTSASPSERVIGGTPTLIQNFPATVQVQKSYIGVWRQNCAGSILTSRFILSSASCFTGPEFMLNIRRCIAGSSFRNEGGQVRTFSRVVQHPLWNVGLDYNGDIAVVEMTTPLQFTPSVQQGAILGQGAFIPDNMPSVQVGWGITFNEEFPSLFASQLQQLNVMTVNNQLCANNYATLPRRPRLVTNNMICAASLAPAGACLGDRGGPLYINNIVVGVVSWGLGCSNATFPTVHTAVSSFTNWIVDNAR